MFVFLSKIFHLELEAMCCGKYLCRSVSKGSKSREEDIGTAILALNGGSLWLLA
jgi:hypothetical protein